jgi:hypothetical protein
MLFSQKELKKMTIQEAKEILAVKAVSIGNLVYEAVSALHFLEVDDFETIKLSLRDIFSLISLVIQTFSLRGNK